MYSNSSRRTGEPWQRRTFTSSSISWYGSALSHAMLSSAEHRRVGVERVASGLVVVRVVHPPADGGVVVAEDGLLRGLADEVRALVGRAAVADGVAQAVVDVDALRLVGLEHGAQGLEVGVNVAEDPDAHRWSSLACGGRPSSIRRLDDARREERDGRRFRRGECLPTTEEVDACPEVEPPSGPDGARRSAAGGRRARCGVRPLRGDALRDPPRLRRRTR